MRSQLRGRGGYREVADDLEHVASAYRVAVDGGDYRLRYVAHGGEKLGEEADHRQLLNGRCVFRDLGGRAAYREGAVSGSGEYHRADFLVAPRALEGRYHLDEGALREHVHRVGTVDGDSGSAVVLLVDYIFEFHFNPLLLSCAPGGRPAHRMCGDGAETTL